MLPRISAALSQFVSPIAAQNRDAVNQDRRESGGFKRFKPHEQTEQDSLPQEEKPAFEQPPVIEASDATPDNVIPLKPLTAFGPLSRGRAEELQKGPSFLNLIVEFGKKQVPLVQIGRRVYQTVRRDQKKKLRKGAILDTRA